MRYVLVSFAALLACSSSPLPSDDGGTDASADVPSLGDVANVDASDGGCAVAASATLSGTFLGQTLTPQDSLAFEAHTTQYEVVVGVADYKGVCGLGNDVKASSNVLAIVYEGATPLAPATIDLAQTNTMSAQYTQYDGTCQTPKGESASSGTVTFTRVDECAVTGSFDLVFNADHVTGTFSAPVCAAAPDGGTSSCK